MHPHDFWQEIEPAVNDPQSGVDSHLARFDDGRALRLPLRVLAGGERAIASLIVNQASFAVVDALAEDLARKLEPQQIDLVVGLPTLGLTLASAVAAKLGHRRYAPLGVSRKFWYRDDLSVPLTSITTPMQDKRLFVDPRLLPLFEGARIALIDDVVSSGASMEAGLRLMALCGVEPVAIAVAMLQSERWRPRLGALDPKWPDRIVAALRTPMLARDEQGRWTRAVEA